MTKQPASWERVIAAELSEFTDRYFSFIASDVRLIDKVIRYQQQRRGKMLRPKLALLTASLSGKVTDDTYKAAIIIELLHNATLAHDDVVDDSEIRRGLPSMQRVFGRKAAVLMGDYMLANSLIAMLELRDFRVFEILSQCARRMARGELVQLGGARKRKLDYDTYLQMIADKTGVLMSATCELGALTAGADREQQQAMAIFGEQLGVAFQIQDDILDYTGNSSVTGKPVGNDLKDGKMTLPLLHLLRDAPAHMRVAIKGLMATPGGRARRKLIRMVCEQGGIEAAEREATVLIEQAVTQLDQFPESEQKQALSDLTGYLLQRKN
jgi:octaprenyl-diphosphate synthase